MAVCLSLLRTSSFHTVVLFRVMHSTTRNIDFAMCHHVGREMGVPELAKEGGTGPRWSKQFTFAFQSCPEAPRGRVKTTTIAYACHRETYR